MPGRIAACPSATNTTDTPEAYTAVAFAIMGPGSTAPSISNLQFSPASAPQGSGVATVYGSMNFTDPDGDLARIRITSLATGAFTDATVTTTATSGTVSAVVAVDTSVAGAFGFTVQAFDARGNASNSLNGTFTVF
jgi:hypothetical protein